MPLNLFLREHEKRNVAEWTYVMEDKSISTKILNPIWERLVMLVPKTVAPNVLSLGGLMCILHAYYITLTLQTSYPGFASFFAAVLIFAYQCLDAIDGKHARNTMNQSAVGELFDQACDNIGVTFLVLTVCRCLDLHDLVSVWFLVQTTQLLMLRVHFKAWLDSERTVRFRLLTGPGEALLFVEGILILRGVLGLDWLWHVYLRVLGLIATSVETFVRFSWDPNFDLPDEEGLEDQLAKFGPRVIYHIVFIYLLAKILTCKKELKFVDPTTHEPTGETLPTTPTKWAICLCFMYRYLPSLLLWVPGLAIFTDDLREIDVICDGVLMSILTSDIILAKMARRNVHQWVTIIYMLSVFDRMACLGLVALYFGAVFGDLCTYMNLPLLTTNTNVYCDGVYDLCHVGHKNLFKAALKFGTRLCVGVVGDNDAKNYKRPPIMNMEERAAEVEGCKGVHKVIRNCPCFGITMEFIEEHMIHVVAHGKEYTALGENEDLMVQLESAKSKGDKATVEELEKKIAYNAAKANGDLKVLSDRGEKYYKIPYELGITEILPRTGGMSTSELIKRCKAVPDGRKDK
eukprot:comp21919_c4_seq1/m.31500 comp21919_c4_seq1/g.31500  ORF comp21919_c4_seq1/g.31500 comp21919_c4_seq1/m.31500 type:complete len:574 (-) comp21919_c4_seq1:1868-3589(-)